MRVVEVKVDRFDPREYQYDLVDAFESGKYKRLVICWPRRSGKDISVFNLLIRAAFRKVGVYYYIFPEYSHAKRALWDSITNDGKSFLDFIPKELIKSSNSQEMKIKLINNSLIQLAGSNKFDSLRGTNPQGIVFSEYAYQDPEAYKVLSPVLLGNGGFALFVSTPNGHNHFHQMFTYASQADDWFAQILTVNETKHITAEDIQKEKDEGLISEDMIEQEYYCSFDLGVSGSFYSKYLQKMRLDERICEVPYNPALPVHTIWDIGVRDLTAILFVQYDGNTIKIIDFYQNNRLGMEHYVKIIREKPYLYGHHIFPHDGVNMEFQTGLTRLEKAHELGISPLIAPGKKEGIGLMDGIECVRTMLPRTYIDTKKCDFVIKTLDNYRQAYDSRSKTYLPHPAKSDWNHCADALRYLAVSLNLLGYRGMTAEELDARYERAMGLTHTKPNVFSHGQRF